MLLLAGENESPPPECAKVVTDKEVPLDECDNAVIGR